MHDEEDESRPFISFDFLGLLVNYNKFEFQNPYQLRLEDFVSDTTIQKFVRGLGRVYISSRDDYIAIQDDQPEGWNFTNTMTYMGLGGLTYKNKAGTGTLSDEEAKTAFAGL